jgi:RNA polymerase sigma factor (sigma-70 family)
VRNVGFAQLLGEFTIGKGLPPDPRLYLYQTAYKSIGAYLRDNQSIPSHGPSREVIFSNFEPSEITSPQPQENKQTLREAFLSMVSNELTEVQRHVMVLYFLEDFNIKETATISGKTVEEINTHLKAIQKVIDDQLELLKKSLMKKKK